MVAFVDLPEFDLESLLQGDVESLSRLDTVCRQYGFFILRNHNLGDLDVALTSMEAFFAYPASEKLSVKRTETNPFGYNDCELTKQKKDNKEIFDIGPISTDDSEDSAQHNQWPTGRDDFKERMSAYYSECEALSLQLVDILCKNLGAEPSTLLKIQSDFVDNSSYLRLNYMPPCPFPAPPNAPSDFDESTWGRLSVGRHTDAGSVTILLQDGVPGLQIKVPGNHSLPATDKGGDGDGDLASVFAVNKDSNDGDTKGEAQGEYIWVNVHTRRGDVVINIGDVVQVWSNAKYIAPEHRVIANATHNRYSMPFFLNPSYSTCFEPILGVDNKERPLYHSISWQEFRDRRAAGDYKVETGVTQEVQITDWLIGC